MQHQPADKRKNDDDAQSENAYAEHRLALPYDTYEQYEQLDDNQREIRQREAKQYGIVYHETLYSWRELWQTVWLQPSVNAFASVLRDPSADSDRATAGLFLGSAVFSFLLLGRADWIANWEFIPFYTLYIMAMSAVLVVTTKSFLRITHFIARQLGGRGERKHVLYTGSAILAPLLIIQGITMQLPLTPSLDIMRLVLFGYSGLLMLLALRATHDFEWIRSILVVVLSIAGISAIITLLFSLQIVLYALG